MSEIDVNGWPIPNRPWESVPPGREPPRNQRRRLWLLSGFALIAVTVSVAVLSLRGDGRGLAVADTATTTEDERPDPIPTTKEGDRSSTSTTEASSTTTTSSVETTTTLSPPVTTVGIGEIVTDFNDIVQGQCFDDSNFTSLDNEYAGIVTVVDCANPHDGEVYAVVDLPGDADAPYPGDHVVTDNGDEACIDGFAAYVGADYYSSSLDFGWYGPNEITWRKYGDRRVICYLADMNLDKLTGSMAGSGL